MKKKLQRQTKRQSHVKQSSPLDTTTELSRRLKLKKTPLTAAFSCLEPDWRAFIVYVDIAANEGDKDMAELMSAYRGLNKREQNSASPEYLCDIANVKIESLLSAVTPLIWRYANMESAVIKAIYNPKVIAKTAKSAMSKSKGAAKDRETFLKVTGALPTPAGARIGIINTNSGGQIGSAGSLMGRTEMPALPEAGEDIMDADMIDADAEAGV